MKKTIIALSAVAAITLLTSCGKANTQSKPQQPEPSSEVHNVQTEQVEAPPMPQPTQQEPEVYVPTLGQSFHFDGFDVFLGEELAPFEKVDNKFSDHHGKDVIVLPVTITNLSGEAKLFNTFFMRAYAPDGLKANHLGILFASDDISGLGKMLNGATATTAIHIEYRGDGDYMIEFDNKSTSGFIKIPVVKK